MTLLVSLANPYVYLDTIFLVGSSALNFTFNEKLVFAFGSLECFILWFFSLGYGAKKLSFIMQNSKVGKIIDIFIALVMLCVAYSLIGIYSKKLSRFHKILSLFI